MFIREIDIYGKIIIRNLKIRIIYRVSISMFIIVILFVR